MGVVRRMIVDERTSAGNNTDIRRYGVFKLVDVSEPSVDQVGMCI